MPRTMKNNDYDRKKLLDRSIARYELRCAINDLSNRGLKLASKWAAEQLIGIPYDTDLPISDIARQSKYPEFLDLGHTQYSDKYLFSRSLLDTGEYQRAAAILNVTTNKMSELPKEAQFVKFYALFMAGEKQKEESVAKLSGPLERCTIINQYLIVLHEELSALYDMGALDGFGLYIFGVVLKEMKVFSPKQNLINALSILIESVRMYAWNWSAWLDLAEVVLQLDAIPEELETQIGESAFMHRFFLLHLYQSQVPQTKQSFGIIEVLEDTFQCSLHLLAQKGLVHFNDRNFKDARLVFSELFNRDPLRMDDLYLYAHVLFVDSAKAELSHLAHVAMKTDQFRPETCCILGNYCSLRGEHHHAIMYFSRAVKLNHKFNEAWTLLGHEYLELKKTGAAIEHYKRGIDANPKDFRAWNGLGHTYELMQMHMYALYYFRRAAALRPYDSRMLNSLASTLEKLGRNDEAVLVYNRSIAVVDSEGIALSKLAKLYRTSGAVKKAANAYLELVETRGMDQLEPELRLESLLFLAVTFRDEEDYEKAERYASMLLDYNGPEKEQAQAILRQIRALERLNDSAMSLDADMAESTGGTPGSFMRSP